MSEELPPIWALNMAAQSIGWDDWEVINGFNLRGSVIAHARTLAKYEQPPVDPKLIEARECAALGAVDLDALTTAENFRSGRSDKTSIAIQAVLIRISREKDRPL